MAAHAAATADATGAHKRMSLPLMDGRSIVEKEPEPLHSRAHQNAYQLRTSRHPVPAVHSGER